MTIKDAILQTLEDLRRPVHAQEVTDHVLKHGYCQFAGRTPVATVSAQLGDFIRANDTRVRRIKQVNGTFLYYLSVFEQDIDIDLWVEKVESPKKLIAQHPTTSYTERSLHKLLSSYLQSNGTYSKTIFHERSNGKDNNQAWVHPDMIAVKFLKLQTKASQNLLNSINRVETFKISSYEIKREINTDNELKMAFFQAVSNSSWANYGYLVALEINESLFEEMERLSQSFGIGIIQLSGNPYISKVLHHARYRDLDFKTIDKLCRINNAFEHFIVQLETIASASDKYIHAAEKEFEKFCDSYFKTEEEMKEYCKGNNIPFDDTGEMGIG